MGFQYGTESSAHEVQREPAAAPSPGKRTLSGEIQMPPEVVGTREIQMSSDVIGESKNDKLAAQVHNREKDYCDNPDASGCFLLPEDRAKVFVRLNKQTTEAGANWRMAITDERLVKLCEHETGWNAFWEIGFYLAMAGATAGLGAGIAALGAGSAAIIKAGPTIIKAFGTLNRGLRIPLRVAVNAAANEVNSADASLLNTLKEMPAQWSMSMYDQMKNLDDKGLLLMLDATDPATSLSVTHFETEILKLLARFNLQVVAIGRLEGHGTYTESCAWITPVHGGAKRLARVVRNVGSGDPTIMRPTIFRSWVSPDMQAMALEQWHAELPDLGPETVTLHDLDGVTAEDLAWESKAAQDAFPAAGYP